MSAIIILPKKSKAPDTSAQPTQIVVTTTPTEVIQDLTWKDGLKINPKILMYHHVGSVPDNADEIRKGLTVSAENFENQMKYLSDNDFQVVTLEKMYEMVSRGEDVSKTVVLTFDDGYGDNYQNAWPIMKKYDLKGTFFIIVNSLDKNEYMTGQNIKDLVVDGNEIGSHSMTHPSLDKLSGKSLNDEITQSKSSLEQLTGRTVVSFCYPSGKFSLEAEKDLAAAGYKIAVTTQKGQAFLTNNPLEVPRYRINPTTKLELLIK